eukprot:CAMPEP_0194145462 /NCGR_PEP_ID=MMETSP0152-20130528/17443_1 /TAXON_ID=1049557 /ORGANISM="Thalassiothrix antarctica, Strain L6-D1" /LENGTH=719 /DNA_ID=CAMNT_0038845707 /DNA_START=13 /DNA_END=2172 /DNA_ORIENTATION=+
MKSHLSISFLAFVAFFLLPVAAVRVLSVDDEGNRELESKSYVVDGSCSYNNPWSGASCMEFRGNDQSSWTSDAMQERCDIEMSSKMTMGKGCAFEEGSTLAGWCVKTISDAGQVEATSMMFTEMANCDMSTTACESFVQGTFVAGAVCDGSEMEQEVSSSMMKNISNILIEDFTNPKYLWESFMLDEDKIENVDNMGSIGSNMFDENGNPKYEQNFSGYENEFKDTGYEEGYNQMMNSSNNWSNEWYKSIVGSSISIVDGVMVFTANITKPEDDNMWSMMGDGMRRNIAMNAKGLFPDLTSCEGLKFEAMATSAEPIDSDEFKYRIEFGYKKLPDRVFGYGYRVDLAFLKSDSQIDASSSIARQSAPSTFMDIMVPLKDFTLDWDWQTGEINTLCKDDEQYCPDMNTLKNMETFSITAVGNTNGIPVELHIRSITGTGCNVADAEEDKNNDDAMQESQWTCAADGSTADAAFDEIGIENMFNPSFNWLTQNDPVMGGASYSTLTMKEDEGIAFFTGEVKNIPFLGLPGFIQMESRGGKGTFPDVSCCDALKLNVMGMEEYAGYRVSFGTKRSKSGFFAQGFKGDFDLPPVGEYGDVIIPFNMFSVEWNEATGDQIITCADDPTVCPDMETLQNMKTIAIWGEGVGGKINLHVKSISAVGCGPGLSYVSNTSSDTESNTSSYTESNTSSEVESTNSSDAELSSKSLLMSLIMMMPLMAIL